MSDMKRFNGFKKVKAKPMTRQEYIDYQGFEARSLNEGEKNTDEGYLVEYMNGGKPNHESHEGYISWSPKQVFEDAYYEADEQVFGIKCTAPQDPDHELTDDEIKRLNETGSLCDCMGIVQYGGDCPIEEGDEFDFGSAIYLLKIGKKVARKGWNGSGMFVYYVPAASYPVERNNLETMGGHFENDMVPYREYLALKTAQGDVATWAPSVSDALATDWCLV